ncbi:hypothetical protein CISIN_1g0410782mg, partial [Citrus sinensis]
KNHRACRWCADEIHLHVRVIK